MSRTGATWPPGRLPAPSAPTAYSLTNSTASPVADAARIRTVGAPTTSTVDSNGRLPNSANWPGMSSPAPPTNDDSPPGSVETAAGVPFGGLAIGCGGPTTPTATPALDSPG